MLRDEALELLTTIDGVEADLRGLESRLTRVRMQLHRYAGIGDRYDINGQKVLSPAQLAELKRLDDEHPPF